MLHQFHPQAEPAAGGWPPAAGGAAAGRPRPAGRRGGGRAAVAGAQQRVAHASALRRLSSRPGRPPR